MTPGSSPDDRHPTSPGRPHPHRSLPSSRSISNSFFPVESPPIFEIGRNGSLPARYLRRGLTFDEVERYGLVDDLERSKEFEQLPISDEDIKKLPRKLKEYYRHLAVLHEHYTEVDGLLSGELPGTIASSFQVSQNKSKSRQIGDLEEQAARGEAAEANSSRRRSRQGSKVQKRAQSIHEEPGDPNDDDAGENTALLSLSEKEAKRDRIARLALNVNTIVNILLVAAKTVAVLYSSSISLTASLVDSALDLLSTFIILGTSWAIGTKTEKHKYPAGKRRFEPLGVLIFSVAMIASFVQVFIESFQRAIGRTGEGTVELSWIGMGTMLATIGIKAIIWVWCSRIPSSGVQALAQDAENDVFFNIMSLAFPSIGQKVGWPLLDPIGGMVLSTYIIVEWVKTLLQNFGNLSGRAASRDQMTRVLYLVMRFNPVLEIADVECYHIGDDLIVEIDVILPRSSSLHFAHDVGETIQCVLESLDGVLRAYVHCDYSSANPPQHTSRVPGSGPANIPHHRLTNGYGSVDGDSKSSSGSATPRPRFLAVNELTGVSPSSLAEETEVGSSLQQS